MAKTFKEKSLELFAKGAASRLPQFGQFELTSRCNLACKMCYVVNPAYAPEIERQELSAKEWLYLAEQARDSGMLLLNLTGGEPMLRNDFWALYEGLCSLGLVITLNTNGTTLTPDTIRRLKQRPPFKLLISLYGASPETYAKVTGNPAWYDTVMEGIVRLRKETHIPFALRTTLIKDNYQDYPAMKAWANEQSIPLSFTAYVTPRRTGEGTDPATVRMTPEQAASILHTYGRDYSDGPESMAQVSPQAMAEDIHSAFHCAAGKYAFFVSWNGLMTPCGLMSEPSVEPLITGFAPAWEALGQLRRKVPRCGSCVACPVQESCPQCPAKRYLETGSFTATSPYLCELAALLAP